MNSVIETLSRLMKNAFGLCNYNSICGEVIISDRPDLCQFQCNGAFAVAKECGISPMVAAERICVYFDDHPSFFHVSIAKPGFINIVLHDDWISNYANHMLSDQNTGLQVSDNPNTIIIDYGGPNIAKPLHIGHLRAAIIGESLKRIMRMLGHNVISDVHLGDWGMPLGLVIAELSERYPQWRYFSDDSDDEYASDEARVINTDLLCEIYPYASSRSKTDPAFRKKAHAYTVMLQNHTPGILALWKRIVDVSVCDIKSIYASLNVDFDLWYGESDANQFIPAVIKALQDYKLLYESDHALVVNVSRADDKKPIPPAIIIKSDGGVNYETTDIATIFQRWQDFRPQKIWYVVDNRQALHFVQVFRCAKAARIIPESIELEHLGFGTMNGADGKPYKTRDGGVLSLRALITSTSEAAEAVMRESGHIGNNAISEAALRTGIASIKFGDLINHRSKDYVFDIKRFITFEGKTGPYVLYMISRICSIFSKIPNANQINWRIGSFVSESERSLLLELITNSTAYSCAAQEKAPNYICEKTYAIANAFSHFYHENRILDEQSFERRTTLLTICKLTEKVLKMNLDALAIDYIETM